MTEAKKIFVSNRLPFGIDSKTGKLKRGSGGLVSALLGVSLNTPFWWMGFETDPLSAQLVESQAPLMQPNLKCQPVLLPKKLYESYYDKFCNDVLWPLFHYEGNLVSFQQENWQAYVEANRRMAEAILKIAEPEDVIWIHDFHFFLLPQMLKEKNPKLKIGFFLHIPFPSTEIYRQLPVREEILKGLSYCDLIGFHEHSYLRHFGVSLKALLGLESSFFKATVGDHTLSLGVYPISIDVAEYQLKAETPEVAAKVREYSQNFPTPFLFLGVDRLDYTKGVELKLRGFRRALEKYSELRRNISLLQVAVPTRTKVGSYIRLKKEVDQLVGAINGEFGEPGYTPIHYMFNSVQETELLALYRSAQSLLVTSKRDGMNLVSMEYVIAQEKSYPGVLILSEFAGAASLLSEALLINPWDLDSTADAIATAYRMPKEEKEERLEHLQAILSKYSATQWAEGFLKDLERAGRAQTLHVAQRIGPQPETWPAHLKGRLEKPHKVRLILDYDGTLVGFKRKPDQAILIEETRQLLTKLQANFDIFILSGRSRDFLDRQFKDNLFFLGAEHGAFYKIQGSEWESRISTDLHSWFPEAERVMRAYAERVPLSFVEKKEASVVWHFRESPTDFAEFQAKKLDDELQSGLANAPVSIVIGSKIVEARAVECNKGSFLRWLMQNSDPDYFYICIGDDRTDEDMFKVLKGHGCSIKVGPGVTAANYRLNSQLEVNEFFKEILKFSAVDLPERPASSVENRI